MRLIDLRSDTVTSPSPEMRKAMASAEVGDDVYSEDPTVNELQDLATDLTGKQAALFVPSGTMGNLIALYLQAGRGMEVLCHENSHIIHYELSSPATIAGVTCVPVRGDRGILTPDNLSSRLRDERVYYMPRVGLIEIENTHNYEGGTCYSTQELRRLKEFARKNRLPIHMDGARLFNASVATGVSVKRLCSYVDTICFCISKGLGAPVGGLLCGSRAFIDEARRVRKMLGGGMRQVGMLAAAGIWALTHNISRIQEDHDNAMRLATTFREVGWGAVSQDKVETNILYVVLPRANATEVAGELAKHGVLCTVIAPDKIRFVTSLAVTTEEVELSCSVIRGLKVG